MVNSHESVCRVERKYEHHFQLPTKRVASPRMLLQAVTEQAGVGNFYIEVGTNELDDQPRLTLIQMRHNTYCISLSENVDMVSL